MKRRALVTGAAGFIGSHLAERLLGEGIRVTALDNLSTGRMENLKGAAKDPEFHFFRADISNLKNIANYFQGIDWVFHLASLADIVPSIVNPAGYYDSNVSGTFSVIEAARLSGVKRFIYAASSSCYGIQDACPTPETAEMRPQYPYALTKYLGEEIVFHWAKVYGLPVVSLRLFNVYGPRSRTSGAYGAVFGVFLAQKLADKPFTVVGDGSQKRDFIYVSDVVEAFVRAAYSDVKNEAFNVGSGTPQSVNRLISLIGGERVHIPKRPGEPGCTWANIGKIKAVLGWRPEVVFEEGVRKILADIDYWRGAPVWTPASIREATREWFKYLQEAR